MLGILLVVSGFLLEVTNGLADDEGIKIPPVICILMAFLAIVVDVAYIYFNYTSIIQSGAGIKDNIISVFKFFAAIIFVIQAIRHLKQWWILRKDYRGMVVLVGFAVACVFGFAIMKFAM